MITLLAHSMMMFYLIGKGKAVKDAMAEGQLTGDQYRRIAAVRKPVFSIGTFAMAVTIVAALLGASVDTGVLPPMVHAMIAYGAIACNLAAVKIEIDALSVVEPHRRRGQSPAGLVTAADSRPAAAVELSSVSKQYGALRPLRIEQLDDSGRTIGSRCSASISRPPKCSSTW